MKRKISVMILTVIMMIMQSGCWGKLELNEIGLVRAMGIDLEPDGRIKLTVLAVMPASNPQSGDQRSNTWIGSVKGKTISEAEINLNRIAPKKIFFYHNKIIILGDTLARNSVQDVIDFLSRERAIRYNSHLLISEGPAYDLLIAPADIDKSLQEEIEGIIKQEKDWGKSKIVTLREFAINLKTKYRCSIAGRIGLDFTNENTFSTFRESESKFHNEEKTKGKVYIEGCAVFRKDKLAGFLDRNEARGYKWIAEPASDTRSIISVLCGKGSDVASVLVTSYSTKLEPVVENGRLVMEVRFESKDNELQHYNGKFGVGQDWKKEIEDRAAEVIREEMESAVLKAQTVYNTDIFGFGEAIYRSRPKLWKSIENDWEKIYPGLEVRYNVEFFIKRPGEISVPIILDEKSG